MSVSVTAVVSAPTLVHPYSGVITSGLDTANAVFNPTQGKTRGSHDYQWSDNVLLVSLGSSDGVDQEEYSTKGNKWIIDNYPQINFIEKGSKSASIL